MRRASWLPLVLAFGSAASCAAPRVYVATAPADARVFVDGQLRETVGAQVFQVPYYGSMRLEGSAPGHVDQTVWVDLAEPVTPGLFPLDFVLEVGGLLLGHDHDVHCRRELPPTEAPATAAVSDLRAKARRMEQSR
jgi:hypothetical protein